ncbi:MAG: glycerate kinase [Pelosinus sp.]|nr:glycerate kinase [Pelosinus sp.]
MKIVVAPDSFKGSLSATQVADAMEQGILSVYPKAQVVKVPIADGGEGTVEALVNATGGQIVTEKVLGPLGDSVEAAWGILGDQKTAVIEMAAASGLPLVPYGKRDPLRATTYGTGELIKAALDKGIRNIIIGLGGSATNDGGAGMARALGAKFFDKDNQELPNGGIALKNLACLDLNGFDPRIKECTITAACDVENPLCGPFGSSKVYGPQKGATPQMVAELDQALAHYAKIAKAATGQDVASFPGAGAAGGLGAGLLFFTPAKLKPGIEIVLEAAGFSAKVKDASLVITGEGNTDFQTAQGKAPVGVAKVAKAFGVPVICLSGGLGEGSEEVLGKGISGLMSIVPQPMALDECIKNAKVLLEEAAARMCRLVKIGQLLK